MFPLSHIHFASPQCSSCDSLGDMRSRFLCQRAVMPGSQRVCATSQMASLYWEDVPLEHLILFFFLMKAPNVHGCSWLITRFFKRKLRVPILKFVWGLEYGRFMTVILNFTRTRAVCRVQGHASDLGKSFKAFRQIYVMLHVVRYSSGKFLVLLLAYWCSWTAYLIFFFFFWPHVLLLNWRQ